MRSADGLKLAKLSISQSVQRQQPPELDKQINENDLESRWSHDAFEACDLDDQHCHSENGLTFESLNGTGKWKLTYYLNGEPKSGTTWLEFIVAAMMRAHCDHETDCGFRSHGRVVKDWTESIVVGQKHGIPISGKLGKNHEGGFDFSPAPWFTQELVQKHVEEFLKQTPQDRWLPILRDPRDVLVSACYHKGKHVAPCSHDARIHDMPCKYAPHDCSGWAKTHYKSTVDWIRLRHAVFEAMGKERAYITFYEALKKDFHGEAGRLAEFLGFHLSDQELWKVERQTAFWKMHKMEKGGAIPKAKGENAPKVRKGEYCSFRSDLNDKVVNEITKYMEESLPSELMSHWQC